MNKSFILWRCDLNIRVTLRMSVLQDLDNKIFKDLISLFGRKPESGHLFLMAKIFLMQTEEWQ